MAADQHQPHHRRSVRLPGFDYSQNGAYFITVCTQGRQCTLGQIIDGVMVKTDIGETAEKCWREIPAHFPNAQADVFIIMPNHIHGIIVITDSLVGVRHAEPLPKIEHYGKPVSGSTPTIVRSFKSAVTKFVNELHNTPGSSFWQRNYYEHIIRDEVEYRMIIDYINSNPMNWESDHLHTGD